MDNILIAHDLLAVLPSWRCLMRQGASLPVHKHFRGLSGHAALEAELRCAFCSAREKCAGRTAPVEDCPNARLPATP